MIIFENVSKFILNSVSIHVPQGETVGLIGASGAGKTTFLKLACGLLKPSNGRIYTMGLKPALEQKELCRGLGVLFADIPVLQKEDTVVGNFELLRSIYQINKDRFDQDYHELSDRLGFVLLSDRPVRDLSLGQRRRVEIGAVLIHRPGLLLLDEPTAGLDENAKQAFYELIRERRREGLTTILTSHDMEEISKLCSRIALLDQGKLLYYGTEEQIKKRFTPMDTMQLEVEGRLPDLEDLPLVRYTVDENRLSLSYDSNCVTAAEIVKLVVQQTVIKKMKIRKPELADVIVRLKTNDKAENLSVDHEERE
ncbi:MAG: ABC transporter ATP-binding protein [Lachnospiraceae bacterium]|nr:ABC transporter ATP-binding protein [Lachnospiraceae bacterium]